MCECARVYSIMYIYKHTHAHTKHIHTRTCISNLQFVYKSDHICIALSSRSAMIHAYMMMWRVHVMMWRVHMMMWHVSYDKALSSRSAMIHAYIYCSIDSCLLPYTHIVYIYYIVYIYCAYHIYHIHTCAYILNHAHMFIHVHMHCVHTYTWYVCPF